AARRAALAPAATAGTLRTSVARGADLFRLLQPGRRRQDLDRARHSAGNPRAVVDARGGGADRAAGHLRAGTPTPAALPGACPVGVLDRYIVRTILGAVALVMAVVLVLGALFVFIDQQRDVGTGNYTEVGAFWYTLLNLPQLAYELLPIVALIGSLLGLGSLARGSELTVVRATGVSVARLASMALLAGPFLVPLPRLLVCFPSPPPLPAAPQP